MGAYRFLKPLLKKIILLIDIIVYLLYYVYYRPWKELGKRRARRTKVEIVSDDTALATPIVTPFHLEIKQRQPVGQNIYDLFKISATFSHPMAQCQHQCTIL